MHDEDLRVVISAGSQPTIRTAVSNLGKFGTVDLTFCVPAGSKLGHFVLLTSLKKSDTLYELLTVAHHHPCHLFPEALASVAVLC